LQGYRYTPAIRIAGDATNISGAARIVTPAALYVAGGAIKNAGEFTDLI
jgi:hypothetical protein